MRIENIDGKKLFSTFFKKSSIFSILNRILYVEGVIENDDTNTMNAKHNTLPLCVLCAGLVTLVTSATARPRTVLPLPAPLPGGYADTESSRCVPLVGCDDDTRFLHLAIAANLTPTNAVQVAFGADANHSEDLEPEETDLVVGCDCGTWFARDERGSGTLNDLGGEGGTNRVFKIKVTSPLKDVSTPDARGLFYDRRWNLAKVTTRGKVESDAAMSAKFMNNPLVIIVR